MPTLTPYEQARQLAPDLAPLVSASFEKARTLKVYAAPGENAWTADGAQVTTDESVAIYGVENGWVLVSYAIGNGTRGRIGYIEDFTLRDAENVAQIRFAAVPIALTRNAEGTDDPLRGRGTIASLEAGDEVTLLAFLGDEWAYVQTVLDDKVCRLFIPRTAVMPK